MVSVSSLVFRSDKMLTVVLGPSHYIHEYMYIASPGDFVQVVHYILQLISSIIAIHVIYSPFIAHL